MRKEYPEAETEQQREDKLDAEFQVQKSPFLAWLDNFWYHYKWHVIVIVFFVSVIALCVGQFVSKPKYDTNFAIGSWYRMSEDQKSDYAEVINHLLPEDYDGNGSKNVNIMVYQIYSNEDVEEEKKIAEAESEKYFFNTKYNTDEFNNFSQFTMTGECSVFLISPHLYATLSSAERLLPMTELYKDRELPQGVTEDGNGIYISQTDFYNYHPAVQVMPDDMILCILKPMVWGGSSDEASYAKEKAFFCAIADFEVKE